MLVTSWRISSSCSLGDLPSINDSVRQSPVVESGNTATDYNPDVIGKLQTLIRVLQWVAVAIGVVLGAVSLVIIMNTIRTAVYVRRREIEIMKLVGATDWFVRWPFIVEGLIVGVVGAAVAVLIVGFGYRPAVINLQSVLIFIPLAFDPAYLRVVLAAMLVFGLLLGSVGSYLGVRRFLKQ